MSTNRRTLLKFAGMGVAVAPLAVSADAKPRPAFAPPPLPVIPPLVLRVTDFGAVGDGKTKNTAAIQDALDRCSMLGGGEVEIPAGRFLTGTVFLRSNTRLKLAEGAELVGSDDLADYPIQQVRWEGKWIKGHCSLIHAVDADNIAIVGPGKIRGSDAVGGVPRADTPLRYPALIEPVNCKVVLFDGFSTFYDRMWNLHPTYCDDFTARNLTIRTSQKGRDGIDVDSCRRVRIENCDIATGDDCIALKSGRGMEGVLIGRPTEDVFITGCTFSDFHWACIGIGSEMSGGVRRVRIENCKFTYAKTHAIYIKGQVGRGGYVEDIDVRNIDVTGAQLGFLRFNFLTSGRNDENQAPGVAGVPHIANFRFRHVRVHDLPQLVEGWEIHPVRPLEGLVLENISGSCKTGLKLAHIKGAHLSGIRLDGLTGPLLSTLDVKGTGLAGAVPLPAPDVLPLVSEPATPYQLR